ncbi:inovirus-type Gp2 protein [Methylotuvimicrobium sp. KM1]|uniref:YagK/YfjJ domain-containing protein n=1 Tax=Methylotuvimicrobium sp. KM1 TaxID=3377707 RepID=UPI00384BEF71
MNNLSNHLFHIGQLTQKIINQHHDPLYTVIDRGHGWKLAKPTALAIQIMDAVEQCLYEVKEGFPIYGIHPYVNVFVSNALDCNLIFAIEQHRAIRKENNLYQVGVDYKAMLNLIIRMKTFVKQVVESTGTMEFEQFVNKAHCSAKKNHAGMIRYIDSLFEHYARLIVIRLDLHEDSPILCPEDIELKYRQVKKDYQHLQNNAKMNSMFNTMVGHIWSLEYGPERGFHYHLVLFFDSSKIKNDVIHAQKIGEYWKSVITNGRGSYWNCNAYKNQYHQCGIGEINYSDVEKINYLKQAAAYLIKVDHYVRGLTPDSADTFGRGEILPPRTSTVGRPRAA